MIITGMAHFESVCKKKLVEWYNKNGYADTPQTPPADLSNVFVVKLYRTTKHCFLQHSAGMESMLNIPITETNRNFTKMCIEK